jgi:hypothetical protein
VNLNEPIFDILLNRWLYESESDALDFKRDQYKFKHASNEVKSEILKDILSIVNSWRTIDGYILIGIEDKADKPNLLIGITEHIDDAYLQQFVNSKTSDTCKFAYATYTIDHKTIGIIKIPIQKRPIYLNKDFGKLKAKTVYVRRGSSTDIATPDEVIKMGLDHNKAVSASLEVGFFDKLNAQMNGAVIAYETTYIKILDEIPEYSEGSYFMMPTIGKNSDYFRDIVEYYNFIYSFKPIYIAIRNIGNIEAVNLRFELEIVSKEIELLFDGEEVKEPNKTINLRIMPINSVFSSYRFEKMEGKVIIFNTLDRLHAKRTLALNGTIYLQVKKSEKLKAKATIFFDGQENPFEQELEINFNCKLIELTWKEFYEKLCEKNY